MTFNWWTFLFEVLNFVVLAFVLQRLLYRPLSEAVRRRREAALQTQAEAAKAHEQAVALQQQLAGELAALEQTRQTTVQEARKQAESERQKILAEAELAVQHRQEKSGQALERDREKALQALRKEAVDIALDLTGRMLREAADRTLHGQLALRLVETLKSIPQQERERLRKYWQPEDGVLLESAGELDIAAQQGIIQAVSTIVGRTVDVEFHTRPELLGGVRLRLGGHVWDASIAGQLEGVQPTLTEEAPCALASGN